MRMIVAVCLAVVLASCGDAAEESAESAPVEQGGETSGDVLGGSISDDMIALEQLTSQSPSLRRAPPTAAPSGDGEGEPAPDTPSEEGAAPEEAAPSR